MAGFKDISLSFAKYTENETIGISLAAGLDAKLDTGYVVTLTSVDYENKSAASMAKYVAPVNGDIITQLTPGKEFIIAEPYAANDKFVVVYRIKHGDALEVDASTANG